MENQTRRAVVENHMNQITTVAAITGIATFLAQGIFAIASGGFTVGSEIHKLRSDIALMRKDLDSRNTLYELRLSRLEGKAP